MIYIVTEHRRTARVPIDIQKIYICTSRLKRKPLYDSVSKDTLSHIAALAPSPRLSRMRDHGFINSYFFEQEYAREVLDHYDFTTYFWRKYGLSDTEHICLVAERGIKDHSMFLTTFIAKRLVKLGYKVKDLYRTRENIRKEREKEDAHKFKQKRQTAEIYQA